MTRDDLPDTLMAKMEGPAPPAEFVSDGCTLAPNEWGGIDVRPACHWHDYHYAIGGDARDRKRFDQIFYRNLRACDLDRFRAGLYYRRVRLFGRRHFQWTDGAKPRGIANWLWLFFTRYLKW